MIPELIVDEERGRAGSDCHHATGIKVRARLVSGGRNTVGAFDIATLTLPSLKDWLRQHGETNTWAEVTVAQLLGHDVQDIGRVWP